MQRALQIGSHLHTAHCHHVPQSRNGGFRALLLWQDRHSLRDARHSLLRDLVPLSTLHKRVSFDPRLKRLGLLQAEGDLFQHLPVCAPH